MPPTPKRLLARAPTFICSLLILGCANVTIKPLPSPTATPLPPLNQEAKQTPAQVVKDAAQALRQAKSVRIRSNLHLDGYNYSVNAEILANGNSSCLINYHNLATGSVIYAEGKYYVQGKDLWTVLSGPTVSQTYKAQWVTLPEQFVDTYELLTLVNTITAYHAFADYLQGQAATTSDIPAAATLDNTPAIKLVLASGDTLYVATHDQPYPIRLERTAKVADAGQYISFSDFNKAFDINAPTKTVNAIIPKTPSSRQ